MVNNKWIVLLVTIKFLLPFLVIDEIWELHRDEYLYYEQGQHLEFGYLENPPLIGVLAYISSLLGGSEFSIKLWSALFGAATLLTVTSIVKELGGRSFAQFVAALGILFSAYMRIHYLFQPNFLEIFFWTLAAYYLLRFINTNNNRYLYLLSVAFALGWWSKYSVLFFVAAFVISIVVTQHRKLLYRKHFWISVLVGIILVLPNIIWQYLHNFPLLHHMKELRETQLQYVDRGNFIKDQFIMLLPVLFVWIGGLIWLLMSKKYRIVGYMFLGVILLLMLGSGKSYYSLGAYPMIIAAGGVWLEKISIGKGWLKYVSIAVILLLSIPFVPVLLPMQEPGKMAEFNIRYDIQGAGLLRWEDQEDHALQQDYADMIGWKELTVKAEHFFTALPANVKADAVVYCRNYGQAGALKYYAKDEYFSRKVICDNGTFLFWIPERLWFDHLIFVGRNMPGKDDEVFNHFEKATIIDSVTNPLSRQYGDKIIFFQNADSVAAKLARDGLQEMKMKFNR